MLRVRTKLYLKKFCNFSYYFINLSSQKIFGPVNWNDRLKNNHILFKKIEFSFTYCQLIDNFIQNKKNKK